MTNPVDAVSPTPAPEARIIDANLNRTMEAMRVIEEYVRFGLDDAHLTRLLKDARHEIGSVARNFPEAMRVTARETLADVGTAISTAAEQQRGTLADVAAASFQRLKESLRCLEETLKLVNAELASRCEAVRYQVYTLEKAVVTRRISLTTLANVRLYVLIDACETEDRMVQLAAQVIEAGAGAIQLREKGVDDRTLLKRARQLRRMTRDANRLLIINDRPDIAVLSRADGVHLGQNDLTVKDARTIVGPETFIGVSTHNIEQAEQAVLDGANYIGCGPTFPSKTKHFEQFPGLPFLRQISANLQIPAFAIGGISETNVAEVVASGFQRIAVSNAVTQAEHPATAVARMTELLDATT